MILRREGTSIRDGMSAASLCLDRGDVDLLHVHQLYQMEPAFKAIDVPLSLFYRFRWLHSFGIK